MRGVQVLLGGTIEAKEDIVYIDTKCTKRNVCSSLLGIKSDERVFYDFILLFIKLCSRVAFKSLYTCCDTMKMIN